MNGGRGYRLAVIGAVVVLVGLVLQLADVTLSDSVRGLGRGLVLAGAVVVAVVFYQAWGTTKRHSLRLHAGTAMALLGGALVAAAVFTSATDTLVGSTPLIAVGSIALLAAIVAGRPQTITTEDRR